MATRACRATSDFGKLSTQRNNHMSGFDSLPSFLVMRSDSEALAKLKVNPTASDIIHGPWLRHSSLPALDSCGNILSLAPDSVRCWYSGTKDCDSRRGKSGFMKIVPEEYFGRRRLASALAVIFENEGMLGARQEQSLISIRLILPRPAVSRRPVTILGWATAFLTHNSQAHRQRRILISAEPYAGRYNRKEEHSASCNNEPKDWEGILNEISLSSATLRGKIRNVLATAGARYFGLDVPEGPTMIVDRES
ncbi:hypothetical protein EV356DRAFT_565479 [Viridothelium virens]|uniref:Uncharacterized protein n=1 Tax=Viridothelium virens TaxID=1048519 RepID=A0A6A6HF57_VIRVR|nr:hypothetical protein EV356DRAFT_565479 [Viridothelium virens]